MLQHGVVMMAGHTIWRSSSVLVVGTVAAVAIITSGCDQQRLLSAAAIISSGCDQQRLHVH
jgi:hypothetical protein